MYKLFILLIILSSIGCSSHRPYGDSRFMDNDEIYFEDDYRRPYITIYKRKF